jgi:hypothetical protein
LCKDRQESSGKGIERIERQMPMSANASLNVSSYPLLDKRTM